jgi:hypothetical protein
VQNRDKSVEDFGLEFFGGWKPLYLLEMKGSRARRRLRSAEGLLWKSFGIWVVNGEMFHVEHLRVAKFSPDMRQRFVTQYSGSRLELGFPRFGKIAIL